MSDELNRIHDAIAKLDELPGPPLGDPAEEADIAAIEEHMGIDYPDDYREFLAEHDGARMIPGEKGLTRSAPFIRNLEFLPLAVSLDEWRTMNEIDGEMDGIDAEGPVKAQFWNPQWVPIALLHGSTQFHCLDLDPDDGGTVGQVIWIADDDERRKVVAEDFNAYLDLIADALESEVIASDAEGVELSDDFWNAMG
jgi:cell wall assembly regulator SMI1